MIAHDTPVASSDCINFLVAHFKDYTEWESGWLHDFVCPHCSGQLEFHLSQTEYLKNNFFCSNCKSHLSGAKYQAAWVYQYRLFFAKELIQVSAFLMQTTSANKPSTAARKKALEYFIQYIDFYADHYCDFPVHGSHVGKGRIMAQSLDEAVFGIHLLRAIYYCKNQIPAEKLYHWKEALFLPMEEFLRPQVESIHNISLWIQCCIGMIGVVFDENAITQQAITGPFGLEAQMQSGLTDDYLWREGSLHYHYYALEALTFFCELYRFSAPRSPLLLVMAEMYRSPLRLSYDGYHLPSLNDGWYPLTLSSYAAQIIKAAYITQDSALLAQKQTIYQRTPELFRQSDIKVLEVLFEEPGNSHVLCFQDHIAILQAPFFIALKSGSSVSTHAHKDVLSIVMDPFSRDLGTPGYGSPITKSWYRNSLSHNTISMDGTQNGSLLQNKVYLHANSSSAPEPCLLWAEVITSEKEDLQKAYRTLSISADDTITDHSVLITEKKHIFDWTFHSDCPITHNAQAIPATSLGEEKYYSFFSDIQEIHPSAIWEAYLVHDKEKLQINISFTPGMHIYLAKSPGNPSTVLRNTLILRQEGTCCDFTVSYRVIQNKAPFCAHTFFPRKKERLQKS